MSLPIDLEALHRRIAEFGPTAFLITVDDQGEPHVVSTTVQAGDDHLVLPVGAQSRANTARHPKVTLLWAPGPDPDYSMIVDATSAAERGDGSEVIVEPVSAVLHRVADAAGDGPACRPLSD